MKVILREMRERRRLNQAELSAASGVPQALISEIENGISQYPRINTMFKLSLALRCTVDDLIDAADNPSHDRAG